MTTELPTSPRPLPRERTAFPLTLTTKPLWPVGIGVGYLGCARGAKRLSAVPADPTRRTLEAAGCFWEVASAERVLDTAAVIAYIKRGLSAEATWCRSAIRRF
jgi:hypothetical protein